MKKAIYPGSFDPPTLGHLDIIKKAACIFDYVYVAIGYNSSKSKAAFSVEERVQFLKSITKTMPNVEIVTFQGLLIDFAKDLNVHVILRAVRNVTDFEYENLQAQINRQMGGVETLFMFSDEKFRLISSSLVRELAKYNKRLDAFVPLEIEDAVFANLSKQCNKND